MNFRQFLENKEKPWIAKKDDVLRLWNSVRDDQNLQPQPVPPHHVGTRFDQDGIRITGSSQFINSVLGRLKPLLFYSNHPSLDLDVKYRSVQRRNLSSRPSFACYINVVSKQRG